MSDNLLLPGAKTAVLVSQPTKNNHWMRKWVIALGVLAVLVGAADALSRLSQSAFGSCAAGITFGPAIGAIDPGALGRAGSNDPCR